MKLPPTITVLALASILLGGFGASRAFTEQILPWVGGHERFVSARRAEVELRNQSSTPEVSSDAVQRAGDGWGERAWTRRTIELPLGVANLLLSIMLFAGALRALARAQWGHSAWSFAARVSIPYAVAHALVEWVTARDGWEANRVLAQSLSVQMGVPAETLADWELWRDRGFSIVAAIFLVSFYVTCALALRRAKVKALFTE